MFGKKTAAAVFVVCMSASLAAASASGTPSVSVQPAWNPRPGEYYPTSPGKFPSKIENPNPQIRNVAFTGKPQDIFTKLNMVTQIQLPEPPVLVNIGDASAYLVDVAPEFASLFVKPVRESDMTNLIVTTERGTYVFVLKENPYQPWDAVVRFGNPLPPGGGAGNSNEEGDLVAMAVSGRRLPAWQSEAMEIRTPRTTAFAYDAALGLGATIELRSAVALPRRGVSVYWLRFVNEVQGLSTDRTSDWIFDEKSFVAGNMRGLAVPDGGSGLLRKGESLDAFLFLDSGTPPARLKFRFALRGNKTQTMEVDIPTVAKGAPLSIAPVESVDERLQRLYKQLPPTFPATPGPGVSPGEPKSEHAPTPPPADGIVIFSANK